MVGATVSPRDGIGTDSPELFYDDAGKTWLVYWSTTIPGRFPETESSGDDGYNHRLYMTKTKDFVTLSKPELFYDDRFNVIDATIVRDDTRFLMFLKDETLQPPAKNIRVAVSDHAAGPYGPASAPITSGYWAEGPTAIQFDGHWVVYFDKYTENRFGAVASADLKHWQDISEKLTFPAGARHGTVFRVPEETLEALLGKVE